LEAMQLIAPIKDHDLACLDPKQANAGGVLREFSAAV
jgi:hypothetical protein